MALMFPSVMVVLNITSVAVLWFGAYRVDAGEMQIGQLTAFLSYIAYILIAVMMSTMMFVMVPRAVVSSERIGEVLETDDLRGPVGEPRSSLPGTRSGLLELRGVEFRYPGAERSVLHGVDLVAEPGRTTAIIGSTGSGKTTLVNLIPRLFDVTGGSVLLDGVDVRELDPDQLWTQIGLVPQKPYLFAGTVRSNLEYGKPGASDEELWHALEVAQARPFVEALPEGLDAPIAQGGTNVSGGQRQRLAIARALVRKPSVYLFDDSFSALDYATDAALRAALVPETRDATVLVVAQRVATIRHADSIVVHGGRRWWSAWARTPSCWSRRRPTGRSCTRRSAWRRRHEHRQRPAPAQRIPPQRRGPGGGGPMMNMGMPGEKSMNFRGSAGRFLREMRGERWPMLAIVAMGTASVVLAVIGPKLLGNATNVIFDGVIGKQLGQIPRGSPPTPRRSTRCGPRGRPRRPTSSSPRAPCPVSGIDFTQLRNILLVVLVDLPRLVPVRVAAGPHDRRRRAARGLPDASARRGEAVAAAAEVPRRPAARRAAQPRHQRHRQRRPDAPADARRS